MEFIYLIIGIGLLFVLYEIYKDNFYFDSAIEEEEKKWTPYFLRRETMNSSEKSLYALFNKYFGNEYIVLSKVRMEDYVGVKKNISYNKRYGYRNRIKSRHVDFLICNKETTKPLLAVELDGGSHKTKERTTRDVNMDKIYSDINLKVIHIIVGSIFEKRMEEIKNLLISHDTEKL